MLKIIPQPLRLEMQNDKKGYTLDNAAITQTDSAVEFGGFCEKHSR